MGMAQNQGLGVFRPNGLPQMLCQTFQCPFPINDNDNDDCTIKSSVNQQVQNNHPTTKLSKDPILGPVMGKMACSLGSRAGRSKTRQQLREVASKWQRWRTSFPWVLVGEHGLACSICRRAGVDSAFARGEGPLG